MLFRNMRTDMVQQLMRRLAAVKIGVTPECFALCSCGKGTPPVAWQNQLHGGAVRQ